MSSYDEHKLKIDTLLKDIQKSSGYRKLDLERQLHKLISQKKEYKFHKGIYNKL